MSLTLPPHHLKIALIQPRIAPNTGNIARLCVATGTSLHLVRPLGFALDDKTLKRSAMDYWPRLNLTLHDDAESFFNLASGQGRPWLFSSKATQSFWDAHFTDGDWLIFGNETHGLPESLLAEHCQETICLPQAPNERCLNLSTAVGIGLFEALRQITRGVQPS